MLALALPGCNPCEPGVLTVATVAGRILLAVWLLL